MTPSADRLATLEREVDRALDGEDGALQLLGYGEVSCVLAVDGRMACKRMPPFTSRARADAYGESFERYLEALAAAGVSIVPTELVCHERADGGYVIYCVQPILDADALGPRRLARAGEDEAAALFDAVLERIAAAVGPRLGVDGQLSNWAWIDGRPALLDLSTPFMRDDTGHELFDTEMYIEALPWVMRGFARRFLLKSMLDKYFQPRGVVVDLLGNLYKERLGHLVPALAARAASRVGEPIPPEEPARYYASDKRTWAMLQAARRADRAWQRRVRRRSYPYLLPGKIER